MKHLYYLSIIVMCLVVLPTQAQYNELRSTRISPVEIPEEILRNHNNNFPGALNYQWEKRTARFLNENEAYFVVDFKNRGTRGHKAFYDMNNELIAYVSFVETMNLPEAIQLSASQYLTGSYVKSGEIIQLGPEGAFLYRVRINNDGLLKYVYFDRYGNLVDKRKISPKVFSFI